MGVALNVDVACALMATCLHELNVWLDKILFKSDVESGVVADEVTTPPGSTATEQLTHNEV